MKIKNEETSEIKNNENALKIEKEENTENKIIININSNNSNQNNNDFLKKIFEYDDSKHLYLPIIKIDCSQEILFLFNYGVIPKYNKNEDNLWQNQ